MGGQPNKAEFSNRALTGLVAWGTESGWKARAHNLQPPPHNHMAFLSHVYVKVIRNCQQQLDPRCKYANTSSAFLFWKERMFLACSPRKHSISRTETKEQQTLELWGEGAQPLLSQILIMSTRNKSAESIQCASQEYIFGFMPICFKLKEETMPHNGR